MTYRWSLAIGGLLGLTGVILVAYASTLPVYTDSDAPDRLSHELGNLPREERVKEWYSRLRDFETPHKRLSDCGRGLMAAALALTAVTGLLTLYQRRRWMRNVLVIFSLWLALWAVRIPLTMWYYGVRQQRFDYPTWGDSIAIGVFQEAFACVVGAVISTIVLGLFLVRHPLPASIEFRRPTSVFGWVRCVFLLIWLFVLVWSAVFGAFGGDEGMTFSCSVAAAILVIFLSAAEMPRR